MFDTDKKNIYPCENPFSQLYLIPRDKLYIRFCPFHSDIVDIKDYENIGYKELCEIFNYNANAVAIEKSFWRVTSEARDVQMVASACQHFIWGLLDTNLKIIKTVMGNLFSIKQTLVWDLIVIYVVGIVLMPIILRLILGHASQNLLIL